MCISEVLSRTPSWEGTQKRSSESAQSSCEQLESPVVVPMTKRYSPRNDTFSNQDRPIARSKRRNSVPVVRSKKHRRESRRPGSVPVASGGRLPPIANVTRPMSVKVQIPRRLFKLLKTIFDEHDTDKNLRINEEEFINAVCRADERRAEQEANRIKGRYFDPTVGDTIAGMAEKRRLFGVEARRKHAQGMFERFISKKDTPEKDITLVDWVAMYVPHLPRSAVKKACEKYAPSKKRTIQTKTLDDVEGAKEEIADMFAGLDTNKDGLVRIKSLEPKVRELGISEEDIRDWMTDLPPVLYRQEATRLQEGAGASISRTKSKLNLQDMQCLLAPVYLRSPKKSNKQEINKQIEWASEIASDAIYGKM